MGAARLLLLTTGASAVGLALGDQVLGRGVREVPDDASDDDGDEREQGLAHGFAPMVDRVVIKSVVELAKKEIPCRTPEPGY